MKREVKRELLDELPAGDRHAIGSHRICKRSISALWPVDEGWRLMERQAGLFSHCFVAQRIDGEAL
jgi:hypothetical protein